jgi:ribosome-associated protein
MARIRLPGGASVDETEFEFRAARAGGPGGQGVNTTSSKVELRWSVGDAPGLSERQKQLVRERLGNRITKDDVLLLQSAEERSQHQNRSAAVARFRALVGEAITPPKRRARSKVSRNQKRKRLANKRHRSEVKKLRKDPRRS